MEEYQTVLEAEINAVKLILITRCMKHVALDRFWMPWEVEVGAAVSARTIPTSNVAVRMEELLAIINTAKSLIKFQNLVLDHQIAYINQKL